MTGTSAALGEAKRAVKALGDIGITLTRKVCREIDNAFEAISAVIYAVPIVFAALFFTAWLSHGLALFMDPVIAIATLAFAYWKIGSARGLEIIAAVEAADLILEEKKVHVEKAEQAIGHLLKEAEGIFLWVFLVALYCCIIPIANDRKHAPLLALACGAIAFMGGDKKLKMLRAIIVLFVATITAVFCFGGYDRVIGRIDRFGMRTAGIEVSTALDDPTSPPPSARLFNTSVCERILDYQDADPRNQPHPADWFYSGCFTRYTVKPETEPLHVKSNQPSIKDGWMAVACEGRSGRLRLTVPPTRPTEVRPSDLVCHADETLAIEANVHLHFYY